MLPLFITFAVGLFGQEYSLNECIQTALSQKKTVLSASLEVLSAEKGVKASFSGVLPSIQAVTNATQSQFPSREVIGYDLNSLADINLLDPQIPLDTTVSNSFINWVNSPFYERCYSKLGSTIKWFNSLELWYCRNGNNDSNNLLSKKIKK